MSIISAPPSKRPRDKAWCNSGEDKRISCPMTTDKLLVDNSRERQLV